MEKTQAVSVLKRDIKRTDKWIPSRIYRNSLELTGQILRSQIERREIYEILATYPCCVYWSEALLARILGKSPLFVLNVQRQVRKLLKRGSLERDYLRAVEPSFNSEVFISSADDSISNGQFKKLKFYRNKGLWFMELKLKLPTQGRKFRWFTVKKVVPSKMARMLTKGAKPKAPLIKKEWLPSGYEIFRLVVPFEVKVDLPKIEEVEEIKVLAVDLSPGESRLGLAVVVEEGRHSRPVFFTAKRIMRKLERVQRQVDYLERKIDRIADDIHATGSKAHRFRLKMRLRHLYQEQKRRQRKIKQLRKEVLEIFTDWLVEYARSYGIEVIAIERLNFKDIPDWTSSKAMRRFTQWFYSRVKAKLEYKAKLRGIRLLEVNPAYTSRYCHRCGRKGKADRLSFRCECGTYDRDYNASVNIGKRAVGLINSIRTGKSKSLEQGSRDNPARVPFRQGLASWRSLLSVIRISKLKAYSNVVEVSAMRLIEIAHLDRFSRLWIWIDGTV